MRVRLTTDRVAGGAFQQEGQVIDLPAQEAKALLAARQAEEAPIVAQAATREIKASSPRRR